MRSMMMIGILCLAVGCDSDSDDDGSGSGTIWNIAPPTISLYEPGPVPLENEDPVSVVIGSESPAAPLTTSEGVILLAGTARPLAPRAAVVTIRWSNDTMGTSGVAALEAAAWSALVPLVPGINRVRVTASDSSGNWGDAGIEVTFR